MGRPPKNRNAEPVVAAKPPMMKFTQAQRLADKNARTIMKISQLLEIMHTPGHSKADPKDRIGAHIASLRNRLNRRMSKLAKWADSSADERHAEFRNSANMNYPYRTLTKPMLYSKPIPVMEVNSMKNVQVPPYYRKLTSKPGGPAAVKAEAAEATAQKPVEETKSG